MRCLEDTVLLGTFMGVSHILQRFMGGIGVFLSLVGGIGVFLYFFREIRHLSGMFQQAHDLITSSICRFWVQERGFALMETKERAGGSLLTQKYSKASIIRQYLLSHLMSIFILTESKNCLNCVLALVAIYCQHMLLHDTLISGTVNVILLTFCRCGHEKNIFFQILSLLYIFTSYWFHLTWFNDDLTCQLSIFRI